MTYTNPTATAPDDTELTENQVYHLIGNSRRRAVIDIMLAENRTLTLSELARRTASETAATDETDPRTIYKSVYVSLQQNHLPKLDEQGVVDYDPERGTVAPGPRLSLLSSYVNSGQTGSFVTRLRAADPAVVGIAVLFGLLLGMVLALLVVSVL